MSRAERRPSAVAQFFTRIKWTYVIVSVFFLVLGILLLVRPEASLTANSVIWANLPPEKIVLGLKSAL